MDEDRLAGTVSSCESRGADILSVDFDQRLRQSVLGYEGSVIGRTD